MLGNKIKEMEENLDMRTLWPLVIQGRWIRWLLTEDNAEIYEMIIPVAGMADHKVGEYFAKKSCAFARKIHFYKDYPQHRSRTPAKMHVSTTNSDVTLIHLLHTFQTLLAPVFTTLATAHHKLLKQT